MSGKIDDPKTAAARVTADGRAWGYFVALDAVRADRPAIGQAILAALEEEAPLEAVRRLAEELGAKAPTCSRCGGALGPEEHDGTCAS